jgi:hypothetical protein
MPSFKVNLASRSKARGAAGTWCTLDLVRLFFAFLISIVSFPLLLAAPQAAAPSSDDYSGMYSFLKDGEFIQITIEEKGLVSGFISRYGDSPSDKGSFLDQFFKSGNTDGKRLSFTTESIHGVWFTFEGTFERGSSKKPEDDGYFVVRGTLTRFSTDDQKKTVSQARQVEFKSFPRDTSPPR